MYVMFCLLLALPRQLDWCVCVFISLLSCPRARLQRGHAFSVSVCYFVSVMMRLCCVCLLVRRAHVVVVFVWLVSLCLWCWFVCLLWHARVQALLNSLFFILIHYLLLYAEQVS